MKLKEIGEYYIGLTYKPEDVANEGTIVLRSGNIQEGQLCLDDIVRVSKKIPPRLIVQPGDILMCSRNGSAKLVGKSTVLPRTKENMTFGAFMTLFRTPYNNYLQYFFLSNAFRRQLATGKTTTINQITINMLDNIDIELPKTSILQKRCEKLNFIKAIISKRKQQLQALDTLIKARFVEMFGDPISNPKDWPVRPLLDMGDCKNGMNFHYEDSGVDLHCLGVGDFQDHSIIADTSTLSAVSLNESPSDEYMLQDDDIVFVRSNGNKALVGRCVAVYPGAVPTTFSGFCIRYRKKDKGIIVPYLLRVLKTDSMRVKMAGRGANIQNLNQQILKSLLIPVPPMRQQEQFATFVSQVDKSKVVLQKALDKAQLLFDGLMQEYFAN